MSTVLLILLLLLVFGFIGGPHLGYMSQNWGYGGGGVSLLVFIVILVLLFR